MTSLLIIGALRNGIIEGRAFSQSFTWDGIDLSDWTASFVVAADFDGPAIITATPALSAEGDIAVALTADEARRLWTCLGGGRRPLTASWQLYLNAPDPEFNEVWQGTVTVGPAIK